MTKSLNLPIFSALRRGMQIFKSKHILIYLILIIILAAGLRTIRAFEQRRYDPDAYLYFEMAEDWSIGGAEYSYANTPSGIPPLLPYLESCGSYIGLSPETTGLLLCGILGSLMPLAAFVIIMSIVGKKRPETRDCRLETEDRKKDIRDQRPKATDHGLRTTGFKFSREFIALLAAFIVAVHPFLIRISVACMRESLYIPLTAFALMCAVIAIKRRTYLPWAVFGILAALGSMTRTEGTEILIAFFVWFIVDILINFKTLIPKVFFVLRANVPRLRLGQVVNSREMDCLECKITWFYYIKIYCIVLFFFLIVFIPVDNYMKQTECTWDITTFFTRGSAIVEVNK